MIFNVSFLDNGWANRLEFCHQMALGQKDPEKAKEAYIRTQAFPSDELFWAKWVKKEAYHFEQSGKYFVMNH